MKEELLDKRNVIITHGKLLGDYVIVGPTKKKSKIAGNCFDLVEFFLLVQLPLFLLV